MLLNNYKTYNEDSKAPFAYYKSLNGKKGKDHSPSAPADKREQKVDQNTKGGKERSGGNDSYFYEMFQIW